MYCIRPDPLRASKRVWLRETSCISAYTYAASGVGIVLTCHLTLYSNISKFIQFSNLYTATFPIRGAKQLTLFDDISL